MLLVACYHGDREEGNGGIGNDHPFVIGVVLLLLALVDSFILVMYVANQIELSNDLFLFLFLLPYLNQQYYIYVYDQML